MEISGWLALLGGVIVGRIINERAYRHLSADEKVRLMDGFSATRAYALIPLFVLVAAFLFLSTQTEVDRSVLFVAYFSLLAFYLVARLYYNQRKLSELEIPPDCRRTHAVAQTVSLLGLAWFVFTLIYAERL